MSNQMRTTTDVTQCHWIRDIAVLVVIESIRWMTTSVNDLNLKKVSKTKRFDMPSAQKSRTKKQQKPSNSFQAFDESFLSQRSSSEYLKQLTNKKPLIRTNSANDLNTSKFSSIDPALIGNPKYKAQEDYYDEIHLLKKELKSFQIENNHMRAKLRRLEEDNARKRKEIDQLCDDTETGETNGKPTSNKNLKQRLFKLEIQIKQKETTIAEMQRDLRWTKGTELEIQNRALFTELERHRIEQLNYIRKNDYTSSIDEETKNVIRKLDAEKVALQAENKALKKKVRELKDPTSASFDETDKDSSPPSPGRKHDEHLDNDYVKKIDDLKDKSRFYQNELDQMESDLKQCRRERDEYRERCDELKENLRDIRHERDQYREKIERLEEQLDRRSPPIKRYDEHEHGRKSPSSSSNLWGSKHFEESQLRKSMRSIKEEPMEQKSSPRSSQEKLVSKKDLMGSQLNKHRPGSSVQFHESPLRTIQAVLRGHLNRTDRERRDNRRESPPRMRRSPSPPPMNNYRHSDRLGSNHHVSASSTRINTGSKITRFNKRDDFERRPVRDSFLNKSFDGDKDFFDF